MVTLKCNIVKILFDACINACINGSRLSFNRPEAVRLGQLCGLGTGGGG